MLSNRISFAAPVALVAAPRFSNRIHVLSPRRAAPSLGEAASSRLWSCERIVDVRCLPSRTMHQVDAARCRVSQCGVTNAVRPYWERRLPAASGVANGSWLSCTFLHASCTKLTHIPRGEAESRDSPAPKASDCPRPKAEPRRGRKGPSDALAGVQDAASPSGFARIGAHLAIHQSMAGMRDACPYRLRRKSLANAVAIHGSG